MQFSNGFRLVTFLLNPQYIRVRTEKDLRRFAWQTVQFILDDVAAWNEEIHEKPTYQNVINALIIALKLGGYNDALEVNGTAGQQFEIALRKYLEELEANMEIESRLPPPSEQTIPDGPVLNPHLVAEALQAAEEAQPAWDKAVGQEPDITDTGREVPR